MNQTHPGLTLTNPVYTWSYDLAGRLIETTSPPSAVGGPAKVTTYTRDALGRITQIDLPDNDGPGGEPRPTITRTHDAVGNVLSETDALGNVTEWVYDNLFRVTQETLEDPDGAGGPLVSPTTSFA